MLHINRLLFGGLRSVEPSGPERAKLTAAGVDDPLTQRYACWRHSLLLVVAPLAAFSGVLAVIATFTDVDTESLSGLGVVAQSVPYLSVALLAVVAFVALGAWARPRVSAKMLGIGWIISVALPVLVGPTVVCGPAASHLPRPATNAVVPTASRWRRVDAAQRCAPWRRRACLGRERDPAAPPPYEPPRGSGASHPASDGHTGRRAGDSGDPPAMPPPAL